MVGFLLCVGGGIVLSACNSFTGADDLELGASGAGAAGANGAEAGNGGTAAGAVCAGVDCGAHGTCHVVDEAPACDCQAGFHAEDLACVADPPDPCAGVVCVGNATCVAANCVCPTGFEGDPAAGCHATNPQEATRRAQLIAIAEAEVGYCEGTDVRPYMSQNPGLWCYDFVAWVYDQVGVSEGQSYTPGSFPSWWKPEPGDLIKFQIQHYGMVHELSPDGTSVTTIEGNAGGCVTEGSASLDQIEYIGTLDGSI